MALFDRVEPALRSVCWSCRTGPFVQLRLRPRLVAKRQATVSTNRRLLVRGVTNRLEDLAVRRSAAAPASTAARTDLRCLRFPLGVDTVRCSCRRAARLAYYNDGINVNVVRARRRHARMLFLTRA